MRLGGGKPLQVGDLAYLLRPLGRTNKRQALGLFVVETMPERGQIGMRFAAQVRRAGSQALHRESEQRGAVLHRRRRN